MQVSYSLGQTAAGEQGKDHASDAAKIAPSSRFLTYIAWVGLTMLLAGELVVLTLPFHAETDLARSTRWVQLPIYLQENLRPAFMTGITMAVFLSWGVLCEEFQRIWAEQSRQIISLRWLGLHFAFLSVLILGSLARRDGRLTSIAAWEGWLLAWAALAAGALVSWCCAAMPPCFWANWLRRSPLALIGGAAVGLGAIAVGDSIPGLWSVLQRPTFQFVAILPSVLGQQTVAIPSDFIIGTATFSVIIGPDCSGIEGMGLISVFRGVYLWYRRQELIFPRALLLIPIGVIAIWFLNVVRIAVLILIGNSNADVAIKGFHSVAGWLLFNALACGLVWASWRFGLFARSREVHAATGPATAYLLPMLILLASTTVARAFVPQLELLYPLGVIAEGSVLKVQQNRARQKVMVCG